jgi:hypothetical protein
MRGSDLRTGELFSYVDLEQRVPESPLLLQAFYSIRSERQLMEQLHYAGLSVLRVWEAVCGRRATLDRPRAAAASTIEQIVTRRACP